MTHDGPTDLMLDELTPDDATRVRLIERTCKWLLDQTYPTKHFVQAAVDLTPWNTDALCLNALP